MDTGWHSWYKACHLFLIKGKGVAVLANFCSKPTKNPWILSPCLPPATLRMAPVPPIVVLSQGRMSDSPDEEDQVCRRFMDVSTNSRKRTGQKSQGFGKFICWALRAQQTKGWWLQAGSQLRPSGDPFERMWRRFVVLRCGGCTQHLGDNWGQDHVEEIGVVLEGERQGFLCLLALFGCCSAPTVYSP